MFDVQYLLNIFLGGLGVVCGYLFAKVTELTIKVQRLEDVQGNTVQALKVDIEKMEIKLDKMTEKINNLSSNIHKFNNQETAMNLTLSAILKHLQRHDEKTD